MSVPIEFVRSNVLKGKRSEEKIEYILNAIMKERKILVLEEALTREEEKKLIQKTMEKVTSAFPGIEIASFGEESETLQSRLIKMLGGKTAGLTIVGPSNLVKRIKRDPEKLRLIAGK